jgi:hypothetical protein
MKVEHQGGAAAPSDEELDAALHALREMLAAQPGDAAKVIEGEAEVVPSIAAAGSAQDGIVNGERPLVPRPACVAAGFSKPVTVHVGILACEAFPGLLSLLLPHLDRYSQF